MTLQGLIIQRDPVPIVEALSIDNGHNLDIESLHHLTDGVRR